jgi:predicted transcriptional regulator
MLVQNWMSENVITINAELSMVDAVKPLKKN